LPWQILIQKFYQMLRLLLVLLSLRLDEVIFQIK